MKPLGRQTIRFPSKVDHHIIEHGYANWWELVDTPCKERHRQLSKALIEEGLNDYQNNQDS